MSGQSVVPASTRVANLSHFLSQAARRHPGEIGFVWRERRVDLARDRGARRRARPSPARRVRHPERRPRAGPVDQLQPDVRIDVRLLPARRGLGAGELPAVAGRGGLSGQGQRRKRPALRRGLSGPCPRLPRGGARACLRAVDRRERFRRGCRRGDRPPFRGQSAGRRGRPRRSLLVLLHLRHDRPAQGGRPHPRPDELSW